MLLNENEGKFLLRAHGIATPEGVIVETGAQLEAALAGLGLPVALKAQIPAGKRGRNGGIGFAGTAAEARAVFDAMIGASVNGFEVSRLLVEPRVDIRRERYVAVTVAMNEVWLMIGRDGGVAVEDNARSDPQSLVQVPLDPTIGESRGVILDAFESLGFPPELHEAYFDLCARLETLARRSDAVMAEINPLVETGDGALIALDARVEIDDSALARQPEIRALLRLEASDHGWGRSQKVSQLQRVDGDGKVGLVGLGGGMALAVSDWLASENQGLAGAIDMDSSLSSGTARQALSDVLDAFDADRRVEVVLVNMISSGNRIDRIAAELLPALSARRARAGKPVVVHLQGNGSERATALLRDAGIRNCPGLREAVAETLNHLR